MTSADKITGQQMRSRRVVSQMPSTVVTVPAISSQFAEK
jgi:hypothetical protein